MIMNCDTDIIIILLVIIWSYNLLHMVSGIKLFLGEDKYYIQLFIS